MKNRAVTNACIEKIVGWLDASDLCIFHAVRDQEMEMTPPKLAEARQRIREAIELLEELRALYER